MSLNEPIVQDAALEWFSDLGYAVENAELHLAPQGMAGFVLANGSMSSNQSGEDDTRRTLIEADLVDCMIALPGQLFYRTQISVTSSVCLAA